MPYDERDDETNRFVPTYRPEEFIESVKEHEPAGTREVADDLGCTVANARRRLNMLVTDGQLERKRIGHEFVYFLED